jgi:hypothetical protein
MPLAPHPPLTPRGAFPPAFPYLGQSPGPPLHPFLHIIWCFFYMVSVVRACCSLARGVDFTKMLMAGDRRPDR